MAKERDRTRFRQRLHSLTESTLDATAIRYEIVAELKRAVGFERWAWPLADPETQIPLAGIAEHDYGPAVPHLLELEYTTDDFAGMTTLASRPSPAAGLHIETGGDLGRSARWDEVLQGVGIADEAAVACRDAFGCWGWLKAYRDSGDRPFTADEIELLAQVGPTIGGALRRSLAREQPSDSVAVDSAPGVVILDRGLSPVAETAAARAWIQSLPAANKYAAFEMLPAMVYPIATAARARTEPFVSRALEQDKHGRWVVVEGACLTGNGETTIAVTFRRAAPEDAFGRLCRLYALTLRERQVISVLLSGADTASLSARLAISPHTVQDHLKSVFAKTGAGSRRELVARFGLRMEPG